MTLKVKPNYKHFYLLQMFISGYSCINFIHSWKLPLWYDSSSYVRPILWILTFNPTVTCARSRLLVFSVLVRIVTGLWISLASRKSTSCKQEKNNKNIFRLIFFHVNLSFLTKHTMSVRYWLRLHLQTPIIVHINQFQSWWEQHQNFSNKNVLFLVLQAKKLTTHLWKRKEVY